MKEPKVGETWYFEYGHGVYEGEILAIDENRYVMDRYFCNDVAVTKDHLIAPVPDFSIGAYVLGSLFALFAFVIFLVLRKHTK